MRHFFIVNPKSGPQDASPALRQLIKEAGADNSAEIHVTKCPGDATRFTAEKCRESSEEMRFYACGGDGTLNEVVNGAAGFSHAAVGCWPCGSGNDFVK